MTLNSSSAPCASSVSSPVKWEWRNVQSDPTGTLDMSCGAGKKAAPWLQSHRCVGVLWPSTCWPEVGAGRPASPPWGRVAWEDGFMHAETWCLYHWSDAVMLQK